MEQEQDRGPRFTPNRYAGPCAHCGGRVEAQAGRIARDRYGYKAAHLDGGCGVIVGRIGGRSFSQNARGRCIDAPCCGCCS